MQSELLNRVIAGLSVQGWLELFGVWIAATVALLIVKWLLVGRAEALAKRTTNNIDDMIALLLKKVRTFFLVVVGLYIALRFNTEDAPAEPVIRKIVLLGALVQAGLWGGALIRFWSDWYIEKEGEDGQSQITAVKAIGLIGGIVLWAILFIVALDNFGIDITALITGLGIGGIAIALAVQNVLQDLLAYISIVVDKPFMHGDFLIVDSYLGSVEHIGLKTTRLKSLSGEQLVISNKDLLGSRIRNFKRLYERRIAFEVGVTYDTPREKLEKIPKMITDIVESQEDIRFDRSHLKAFGDFAITFETVYFVLVPDYAIYMDRQQAMNLAIHKAFEENGIEFAFPTQSLHIESVPERLLGTNGTSGKGADGTGSGSEATANPGGAGKS
ncbi:MAG: mechanosensitive ion channel family protein [Bacteroidetes bacterium]|nr:mechanosensitive ion channel family protein [Bacteroidota bacterium]